MLLEAELNKLKNTGAHMEVVLNCGGAEVGVFTLQVFLIGETVATG